MRQQSIDTTKLLEKKLLGATSDEEGKPLPKYFRVFYTIERIPVKKNFLRIVIAGQLFLTDYGPSFLLACVLKSFLLRII